jgi:hypothetical protein
MTDKIIIEYQYIGPPFKTTSGGEWKPKPGWHKWKSYAKQKSADMALESLARNFGRNGYEFRIKPDEPN